MLQEDRSNIGTSSRGTSSRVCSQAATDDVSITTQTLLTMENHDLGNGKLVWREKLQTYMFIVFGTYRGEKGNVYVFICT